MTCKLSVSLRYQLVRRYYISNWSALFTYQWEVTKLFQISPPYWHSSCDILIMSQHGLGRPNQSLKKTISFAYYAVHFSGVSGGWVSLRYHLVRCYNVLKTSVLFRYQLWRRRRMMDGFRMLIQTISMLQGG